MDCAHMAREILTSRGRFMVQGSHFLFINWDHNPTTSSTSTYGSGLSNESKLHGPYYLSYTHGKRLLQQEPIFTQNDNKTWDTSYHLRLMIQAHKSPWGNFGSRGLKGQDVYLVKFQWFKVDKRNMLLGITSSCVAGNIW